MTKDRDATYLPRQSWRREATATTLLVLTWVVAVGVTLWFAHATKLGPVMFTLGETHGVHEGDVVAAVLFAGFAGILSALIVRWVRD